MPDQKISQLTGGGAAQATDEIPIARSGANFKITGADIAAAATTIGASVTQSGSPLVNQADIGSAPNEIPLNQYLGTMAYQDAAGVNIAGGTATLTLTSSSASTTFGVGGATPSTSGSGISFPATQSASTDANTLDDYEEGVFDPTITFGGASVGVTYNTSFTKGSYTKVGNRVFVGGYILLTSKGSSTGDASIGGLPFTSASGNTRLQGATVALLNVTFANQFWARIAANVTTIDFYESTEAGVASALTNADFANNSEVYFTAHYAIS